MNHLDAVNLGKSFLHKRTAERRATWGNRVGRGVGRLQGVQTDFSATNRDALRRNVSPFETVCESKNLYSLGNGVMAPALLKRSHAHDSNLPHLRSVPRWCHMVGNHRRSKFLSHSSLTSPKYLMITLELPTDRETNQMAESHTLAPTPALDLTDERLMEMVQHQNPEALAHLHDRYGSILKALIMRVIHNDAESDDMLQEIFVEIWNRAASYDPSKGKPLGWMVTLSRRRAIDRLRKRQSYSRMEERLLEETKHEPQESSGQLEEDVAHAEMREHLTRALATLPIAQKQAVELAYYSGMSQREIAAHTGIPLGTIKTRLELGMRKLSDALKGLEDLI